MPAGTRGDAMNITDMTEAELEKEFREDEEGEGVADGEEEEEEEAGGERNQGGRVSSTPSTERPSSSDSLKTTSGHSDLVSM